MVRPEDRVEQFRFWALVEACVLLIPAWFYVVANASNRIYWSSGGQINSLTLNLSSNECQLLVKMNPKPDCKFSRAQKSANLYGGPNWILIAGGALLSTLSIRLGCKLKNLFLDRQTANATSMNGLLDLALNTGTLVTKGDLELVHFIPMVTASHMMKMDSNIALQLTA
ncbi:hypothetical protein EJ110_NYTH05976 [Nymphaea thermarum]|nr:hypothetical protein EJ110_NYTH05976 [Nymphaea thermarum]